MTFRPSVLPDRDNNVIDTFIRTFERARQSRRADQAQARADAEFTARQEDREARKQEAIFQTRLDIARDPTLQVGPETGPRAAFRQQAGAVSPAGGPDIASALRGVSEAAAGEAPVPIGVLPGTEEEVSFLPQGQADVEAAEARRAFEEAAPEREAQAQERREIDAALEAAGVPIEERRVLVRDPPAARQRLQSLSTEAGRRETGEATREAATTGGERERSANIAAIQARGEEVGRPITDAQAAIFEANPDQLEDFLRPIPEARQEQITADLDRMQDILDDIEGEELSNAEKLTRKKRALIDGGFMGPAEDFATGLRRFQDSRREMREMAGTFLQPVAQPGAGPAPESGLGGDEPRQTIASGQIPAAAALIEDLNFAERNEELDRVFPGLTATDRAAIMRAAGPAPVISGQPGSQVGDEPQRR